MSDPFKSILTLGKAKDTAKLADLAAKEMARHCDERIDRARTILRQIKTHAHDGQNGSANYAFERLAQIEKIATLALKE